jgi:membrane associated rhomboid family serine protease
VYKQKELWLSIYVYHSPLMQPKHFPVATTFLIVINSIIFGTGFLSGMQTQIIQNFGFIPNHIFHPEIGRSSNNNNAQQKSLTDSLTRIFASMFIHANFVHIAFNLFALAYLGVYAERAIGARRYLLVYFISGIVAALFHGIIASYIFHNGNVVLIGASGAISGVLGTAAALGNKRAYYWLMVQILFAVIGSVSALSIAFTAHIGGFIAGVLMTKALIILEQSRRKSRYFLQP